MDAVAACAICGQPHSALEPCAGAAARAGPVQDRVTPAAALSLDGADEMVGQSLGNFRIVRMLGKGGMGTVYLGEHAIIGSKVAIKFLHSHLVGERTLVERFFAEATAVNLIGHENIVSIYDLSMLPPNRWYLVMEYLDGVPLSSLAGAPMPPEMAVPILMQACDALQAAHAANVIHRDLKPENVFLVKRGGTQHFVKLVDFGIAKLGAQATGSGQAVTAAGLVVGTPEYMAPEQWVGESIDGRADLYALGVIAYLLATGQLPFHEATPLAYYAAHQEKLPDAPRALVPSLPEAYEDVILRALSKRREERFQTALEMREALRRSVELPLERQFTPFPGRLPTPLPPVAVAPQAAPLPPPPVIAPGPVARQPTPARVAALPVSVSAPGLAERTLQGADLTKAGLFVQGAPPFPPLFSRVQLVLRHPQRPVELCADVVRYVDAAQAQAWALPGEGFAVQFAQLSAEQREVLSRLVEGKDLEGAAGPARPDDPAAEAALDAWQKRLHADHYTLLMADFDSDRSEVRGKLRRAQQELVKLRACPLSPRQKQAAEAIDERLKLALAAFQSPVRRAEYDATLANWKGISRCMAEGLGTPDMRALRASFLAAKPKNEANALLRAVSAAAMAKGGNMRAALQEYEGALELDPLNDEFHRQFWALKRRMAREG